LRDETGNRKRRGKKKRKGEGTGDLIPSVIETSASEAADDFRKEWGKKRKGGE